MTIDTGSVLEILKQHIPEDDAKTVSAKVSGLINADEPDEVAEPFSWNVFAISPDGAREQFTVRAKTSTIFLQRIAGLKKWLVKNEYRFGGVSGQPTQNDNPAVVTEQSQSADAGTARCIMLKVEKQFKDPAKPKLVFECEGLADPVTCSWATDKLANLLAPVGVKANQIKIGAKLPGGFNVEWKREGKYINIVSVSK